ncbi:MAG: GNAT family N-acetyltransferase [Ruthenibacterium lactatiformans]
MVHLEQAQPEQLQELLAFAEEAFRTPEGKVDFPTLLPKLYGPGADSAPLHTVLYEDGAPSRAVLPEDTDFNIAGTALRVGGIGTVCVDGRSRGKGHLALLMQDAQERMQAAGCDIAMLGGQRQRCERFGYVPRRALGVYAHTAQRAGYPDGRRGAGASGGIPQLAGERPGTA